MSFEGSAFTSEIWEYRVESGLVVVRADTPSLFYLNATATVIWEAYSTTGSKEAAANALVKTFGIAPDAALSDVLSTLSDWTATGLVGRTQTASSPGWDGRHGDPMVIGYFSLEGTTFLVLTDSQEVMADVVPRLKPVRVKPSTPDVTIAVWGSPIDSFVIVAADNVVAIEQGVGAARAVLFQELVRSARPGREWLALLHAAACAIDGRCVLLPGSSYSGKSTLSAAAMATGLTVYSDDFVGIEVGNFHIPPMPFAVAVRPGGWPVLQKWIPELDGCAITETFEGKVKLLSRPLPSGTMAGTAAALVFSEWAAGSQLSLKRLSISQTIERLNRSGFWVAHERDHISEFLALLQRLPKYALRYGDLAEGVAQLKSILAES